MIRPSSLLRGRVAVVTGSTHGTGLVIAASLAQAGAKIVISGHSMDEVEAVYGQFAHIPGIEVLGVECDVRDLAQVQEMADRAVERFGQIDIWFNTVGIYGPRGHTATVSADAWRSVIDTNLVGTFHGTRVALQYMLARNSGKIINLIGSGARGRDQKHPFLSAYLTSNAAILRFTQIVAIEYQDTALSILAMSTDVACRETTHGIADRAENEEVLEYPTTTMEEVRELAVQLAGPETDGETGRVYEIKPSVGQVLRDFLKKW